MVTDGLHPIFTTLENTTAGISQRIAIENLVDLKSRTMTKEEPWFPCRRDDWMLLNDGTRGKVIGISQELVELVERGGARKTYLTQDFLRQAPRNSSVNFRLKETIGISHDLQESSTKTIPETLRLYLMERVEAEGYAAELINLQVEFQAAGASSNVIVIGRRNIHHRQYVGGVTRHPRCARIGPGGVCQGTP